MIAGEFVRKKLSEEYTTMPEICILGSVQTLLKLATFNLVSLVRFSESKFQRQIWPRAYSMLIVTRRLSNLGGPIQSIGIHSEEGKWRSRIIWMLWLTWSVPMSALAEKT